MRITESNFHLLTDGAFCGAPFGHTLATFLPMKDLATVERVNHACLSHTAIAWKQLPLGIPELKKILMDLNPRPDAISEKEYYKILFVERQAYILTYKIFTFNTRLNIRDDYAALHEAEIELEIRKCFELARLLDLEVKMRTYNNMWYGARNRSYLCITITQNGVQRKGFFEFMINERFYAMFYAKPPLLVSKLLDTPFSQLISIRANVVTEVDSIILLSEIGEDIIMALAQLKLNESN
jgi:hypothetical protein